MIEPYLSDPDFTLYVGDVRDVLRELPAASVDCVVTSPPYWGLRDYGEEGQIGLEATPQEYVATMVEVFREVRRVLAPHGTVWLNLGDSYASSPPGNVRGVGETSGLHGAATSEKYRETLMAGHAKNRNTVVGGLKAKDLVGIPWRVAFALQDDGWYLRSDIIWAKPNPMPEAVTDRPTKAHEYVFMLSQKPRYYFDQEAVREPAEWARWGNQTTPKHNGTATTAGWIEGKTKEELQAKAAGGRNIRSVWTITTQPYADAHFATFPEELPRRAILAGCPEWVCRTCGKPRERLTERIDSGKRQKMGDGWDTGAGGHGTIHRDGRQKGESGIPVMVPVTVGWSDCDHNDYRPGVVLDPFIGSGTTAYVARKHGRHAVGVELNPEYAALIGKRTQQQSLLS